jgi:hypothetical protein
MIPNASFEDTIQGNFGLKYAANWNFPSKGQAEYYTIFHNQQRPEWGVPNNYSGYQHSNSGNAFIGIRMYSLYNDNFKRVREYIQSRLVKPLKKDSIYCMQLYVSLADSFRYASRNQLGIYFSQAEINLNTDFNLPYTPQIIVSPDEYITDKKNWLQFDFEYTASGGEGYIILGNFNDTTRIDTLFVDGGRKEELAYIGTYYYVDDVYLGNCDSIIGLPEISLANQINVYPNPAKEQLFISYEGNEKLQLKLYNLVGQIVEIKQSRQAKNLQIPLNHLSKGVYLLEIIAGEQRISRKVIKR